MDPELIFKIVNAVVMGVWLLMIFAPRWKITQTLISSFSVVLLIACIYGIIIITQFGKINFAEFASLKGIMNVLHTSDLWGSSAIWYHLLAFDLVAGTYLFKDSQKSGIPHLYAVPCLIFTFMLGPLGFLLYQMVKFFHLRNSPRP